MVRNVTELVDPPRPKRAEMRTLSPEEARRFLSSLGRADRLEALYVLAITAGLRQGELLGLRWREVDLDEHKLRVTGSLQRIPGQGPTIVEPKTRHSRRVVMLGEEATEALWHTAATLLLGAGVHPKVVSEMRPPWLSTATQNTKSRSALVAQGIERRFPTSVAFVGRRSSLCVCAGHKRADVRR